MDYKEKYRRLRRTVKRQVFINAALFDEITSMEENFQQLKNERRYLLKRLFKHLPMTESQVLESTKALNAVASSHPGKIPQTMLSPVQPDVEKQGLNESKNTVEQTTEEILPKTEAEVSCSSKRKRKKPGTVTKKVQALHMNELNVPIFPITIGALTVYDIGENDIHHSDVLMITHFALCLFTKGDTNKIEYRKEKPGFHSERYIWPVGYCSTRLYPSMLDPEKRIQYFCYIKDGGGDPTFVIIAEDEPDKPISALTATACHCIILKRLNKARGKETTNTGSGPEFFGFSHSTIQYLIQCLPGADKCEKYIQQKFEFSSPPPSTSWSNVIHEGNLPKMENYDRTSLKLPELANNEQQNW